MAADLRTYLFTSAVTSRPDPNYWGKYILREMGNALGLGDLWSSDFKGCASTCRRSVFGTSPAYYDAAACPAAAREYAALGCGSQLPLETNDFMDSCSLWSESDLPGELFTQTLTGSDALSRVTIGAVEDLYGPGSVDYSKADPWSCGRAPSEASPAAAP